MSRRKKQAGQRPPQPTQLRFQDCHGHWLLVPPAECRCWQATKNATSIYYLRNGLWAVDESGRRRFVTEKEASQWFEWNSVDPPLDLLAHCFPGALPTSTSSRTATADLDPKTVTVDPVLLGFQRGASAGAEQDRRQSPLPENGADTDYVFRKVGDTWEVSFARERASGLKDLKGMRYIAAVIARPNMEPPLGVLDLERNPRTKLPQLDETELSTLSSGHSYHPRIDHEAGQDYYKHLEELREELSEAKDMQDLGRSSRIADQIADIQQQLQLDTGMHGRIRQLGARSPHEQAAQRVAKCIAEAIDHLRDKGLKTLATHLQGAIKRDRHAFAYRPEQNPPSWTL